MTQMTQIPRAILRWPRCRDAERQPDRKSHRPDRKELRSTALAFGQVIEKQGTERTERTERKKRGPRVIS